MEMQINNPKIKTVIENKFCPTYNKIIYASYFLTLVFNILIIASLVNIEKLDCQCADIPEKRFLKEWFIFNLIFNFLILLSFVISDKACYYYIYQYTPVYVLTTVVYFITFVMLIRMLAYLNIMRKGCKCGYGKLESFLFYYFIIIFSFIALFILLLLILFVLGLIKIGYS